MSNLPDGIAAAPNEGVGASRPDVAVNAQQLTALIPKAVSYVQHLLRIERRPWAIVTGAAFGAVLMVGHVVGGVSGLIEGYGRFVRTWFPNEITEPQSSSVKSVDQLAAHTRALANELRAEFIRARDKLEQTGSPDFSRVQETIAALRRVDEQVGHVWYFEGEMKRIANGAMFTSKSCLKPLPPGSQSLDAYQQDFYRYLEIANSLPAQHTSVDTSSEICYQRADGVCVQRTAWIHQLLATDMYQMAMAIKVDDPERVARLEQARKHADEALRYRSPEGIDGFVQCIGTAALHEKIQVQLKAAKRK